MKERPLIFSGPMVRAVMEGRKTQTRRLLKPQPQPEAGGLLSHPGVSGSFAEHIFGACFAKLAPCPYGSPSDRLWVREAFGIGTRPDLYHGWRDGIEYRADDDGSDDAIPLHPLPETVDADGIERLQRRRGWKPGIHMPRWASRLLLEVTEVRAQRLQDITEDDARAEGIDTSVVDPSPRGVAPVRPKNYVHARECFADLWDQINGDRAPWASNPWVWAITFRRVGEAGR